MPLYPNPNGGSMEAANDQQAAAQGWSPSMGTFGLQTYPDGSHGAGNAPGGGGGGGATVNSGGAGGSTLDGQFQRMLAALASGNREAFEEAKNEWNRQFEENVRQYNLNRGDALDQFAKNYGLNLGQLTGVVNGQPTLPAQQQAFQQGLDTGGITGVYNGAPTEAAREFNQNLQSNLGTTLLNAATQLRGPADYLQYQMLTRGGQNLMQQLFGDQSLAQTQIPAGANQPATLANALGDLGLLGGGGGNPGMPTQGATQGTGQGSAPTPIAGAAPVAPTPAAAAPAPTSPYAENSFVKSPGGALGIIQGGQIHVFPSWDAAMQAGVHPDLSNAQASDQSSFDQWWVPDAPGVNVRQAAAGGMAPGAAAAPSGSWGIGPTGMLTWMPAGQAQMAAAAPAGLGTSNQFQTAAAGSTPSANNAQASILSRFGLNPGTNLSPTQINPGRWDAMGQIGRDLTKNLAQTVYGYDPTDFENQINATRPQGTARVASQRTFRPASGLF